MYQWDVDPSLFPPDLAADRVAAGDGAEHTVRLPDELAGRLDRIGRGRPEAVRALLAAGRSALASRYTRDGTHRTFRELLAAADTDSEPGPAPDGMVRLCYDASRFTAAAVARIGRHYAMLLDAATTAPDIPVRDHDLWTAADAAVVAAANATDRAVDGTATIHGLIARTAALLPDAPALLTGAGAVTYADLDRRADRLARTLIDRGAGPGTVVAVVAERSVTMVVAILAVLKAGAAYLPVDPAYPPERIGYLLADSRAALVLAMSPPSATNRPFLSPPSATNRPFLSPPSATNRPFLSEVAAEAPVLNLADERNYPTGDPVPPRGAADDAAYVIYTSGSTGTPKGVVVEHRSVVNRLAWMQREYPLGPRDVVLQKTSISFDVSVWELFWWALSGAALALLAPGGEKDPAAIVAAVQAHRVTTVHFVPSMLVPFLGHLARFGDPEALRGLRHVFASGEALTPGTVRRFAALLPGAALVNLYGPTEATVDATHHRVGDPGDAARVPIGRPIDNVRAHVLDERGGPVPVGLPGELYLAGVGLARGYLHRPELTAERFVAGPAVGEERLYRTGDLARWLDDGSLDFLGRVDRQVKVRGFRVEPGEIEERLRAHRAVRDAAVVAVDDGWQTSLRGFAVATGVDGDELRAHLAEVLPDYLVPARVTVVDALPLTPNGKLDHAALLRPPVPAHMAPRDERERTLAAIWQEVLGAARVGVHDNFFALGGNSIHFVSVLAKARDAGLGFTFQQLFRHQTVAALLGAGDVVPGPGRAGPMDIGPFGLLGPADRERVPTGAVDAYPLSLLQAGLIFQTEVTGALGQYHDVLSYVVRGAFDTAAFERAVRLLVRRHPILRTTYDLTGFSEFVQVVHDDVDPPLTVVDLRDSEPAERDAWHEAWLAAEKRRPFEWTDGRLVGLHVQILTDDRFRYTVSQHNSALDGWSISLLHTQLFDLYHRIRDGRVVAEPAPDHHLRNFVGLERAALDSVESAGFWRGVLDGTIATEVPRRPGAPADVVDFRVIMHDVPLPAGLTERLTALADKLSVPIKELLLAVHVKVLATVAGGVAVMTGYEHSGRPELPDADQALGLYLNTVPLRVDVGAGSWEDLVRDVYRAELDLLPHRRYPMARMKQDLATQRALFETTFNFTHFYLMKRLRELPGFELLDLRVDSETEFALRTEFSRHFFDDEVRLSLHYHEHLFDADQIERVGGYFVRALELMTGEPGAPHTARPLAGPDELATLAAFGERQAGGRVHVVDPHGLPAPIGTPGAVLVDGRPTGERGRWLPDGTLQVIAGSAPAPAPTSPRPSASAWPSVIAPAAPPVAAGPGGAVYDRIRAAWSVVLDQPADRIGPGDDFFLLGGNSLSALRVTLDTDGLVTLTDLTRHPRLAELTDLVERRQRREREVLQLLSSSAAGARCALVCVPYPCGHPINFRPLALALEELTTDLVVYGLEAPGHDRADEGGFVGVPETARLAVEELLDKADLPVLVWGHCGGAAVALELVRQLEERGHDVRGLLIGSKLLPPIGDMRESIEMIEGWSAGEIVRFMVDETGYTDLDGLAEESAEFMARQFRHDVCTGFQYLIDSSVRLDRPVAAPLTVVVAADDAVLAEARGGTGGWNLLAGDVRPEVLDRGGHYFVRTNPDGVADLVVRVWEG